MQVVLGPLCIDGIHVLQEGPENVVTPGMAGYDDLQNCERFDLCPLVSYKSHDSKLFIFYGAGSSHTAIDSICSQKGRVAAREPVLGL